MKREQSINASVSLFYSIGRKHPVIWRRISNSLAATFRSFGDAELRSNHITKRCISLQVVGNQCLRQFSSTTAGGLTTASGCRLPTPPMSRPGNRERCGKRKIIRKMTRVYGLIPNFAGGIGADALWRLCASSRLANHRSVFHGSWLRLSECKHFQENVNETRNAVNDVRKTVNLSSKTTVNHIRK